MRLTLRTLLAWLDDTLTPSEVRDIGRQVSESPFARDLVAKIQKVTRQRRLTIPHGDDAVDPNIVAAYLDNELEPDAVTNFEKVCLTSDVHLAEVSSIHQILSLIGQKAKVPEGVKERMYRRVKGRENRSATKKVVSASPVPVAKPARKQSVTPSVSAWKTPQPQKRMAAERFGPVAIVSGLLGLLILSAWMSVKPGVSDEGVRGVEVAAKDVKPAEAVAPRPVEPIKPEAPLPEARMPEPANEVVVAKPAVEVPSGVYGKLGKTDAVVLKYVPAIKEWEKPEPESSLKAGDRLINLTPGITQIGLTKSAISLVGQGEVALKAVENKEAARVQLVQGRIVVRTPDNSEPIAIEVGQVSFTLASSRWLKLGVGRELARSFPATELSNAVVTLIALPEGEVTLTQGATVETIVGPKVVALYSDSDKFETTDFPPPTWVSDENELVVDAPSAKAFNNYFSNRRPVAASLAEAIDDELPEVRRLALRALALLGDLSLVVPCLSQAGSQSTRVAAVDVLRDYRARGVDQAEAIWEELRKTYGDNSGRIVEKLLIGYNPNEAKEEMTIAKLVTLLGDSDLGVRQLALETLKTITHRDSMEYDPEQPEGKGLRAWQEALKSKSLMPTR